MARIRTVKPELFADTAIPFGGSAHTLYCIAEIECESSGPCKVGIAADLSKRLSALQGGNWRPLVVVWCIRVPTRIEARDVEQHLLCRFRPNPYSSSRSVQLQSEWVSARPLDVLKVALEYLNADCDRIQRVA